MNNDIKPYKALEPSEKANILLNTISKEVRKIVKAKTASIFINTDKSLKLLYSDGPTQESFSVAKYCFETGKNYVFQKNDIVPNSDIYFQEPCIAALIATPEKDSDGFTFGVIVLHGVLNFENFSQNDLLVASSYCEKLSVILNNAYFHGDIEQLLIDPKASLNLLSEYAQYKRDTHRLEFLLSETLRVTRIINSSHHLTNLLRQLMESVKSVFLTESCSILLVDKEKNDLYFHIIAGEKEEEISKIRVPMGKGIAGTVAITREPMIINDAQNDDRVYKAADKTSGFVTRNILAAPLVVGDEVIGVMEGINTIGRDSFDEEDINFFLTFSHAAAVAIQKARLVDDLQKTNIELEKRISELESLFDLGQAVLESKNIEELIRRSIRIIVRELDSVRVLVIIKDYQKTKFHLFSYINGSENYKVVNSLSNSVIIHSILEDKTVLRKEQSETQGVHKENIEYLEGSYIILPIKDSDKVPFGAVCISERQNHSAYDNGHLRLLQTISSQFIKGYENIKLNEKIILQKAVEKEIQITSDIQKHILPSDRPRGSNFELGIKSVAAKEVSGDFYDFYKYEDGQFSFLIADVSGKSLPAAIFMAMSSSVMRTLGRDHKLSPDEILRQANLLIYEDSQSGMFVTLFFIHYNPAISLLEYASAGHNDQILIKADGSYSLIKGKGAPLGVINKGNYIGGSLSVVPGDMIVLYTDGAIEEKNENDEEFGLERFIEEIIKRRDKHPDVIIEEVYQTIMDFSNSSEQYDDFTVLILKFNDDYQFHKVFSAINSEIPNVRDFIENTINVKNLDPILKDDILLCCDEAATNIVMHSYKDLPMKNPKFECFVKFTDEYVRILLVDQGSFFDRSIVKKPSLEANLKGERKGGFGIFLIEKLMDTVEYKHENGTNYLLIEKQIR